MEYGKHTIIYRIINLEKSKCNSTRIILIFFRLHLFLQQDQERYLYVHYYFIAQDNLIEKKVFRESMQNWIYTWFKKKKRTVLKEVHPEWQLCFFLPIPLTSPSPLFWSPPYFQYIYPPMQYTQKEGLWNQKDGYWKEEEWLAVGRRLRRRSTKTKYVWKYYSESHDLECWFLKSSLKDHLLRKIRTLFLKLHTKISFSWEASKLTKGLWQSQENLFKASTFISIV